MMLQGEILRSGTVFTLTGLIFFLLSNGVYEMINGRRYYLIEWLKDHDNWSFSLFSGGVMPAQGLAILLSLLEG